VGGTTTASAWLDGGDELSNSPPLTSSSGDGALETNESVERRERDWICGDGDVRLEKKGDDDDACCRRNEGHA
jgi:hypothetical protein